VLGDARRDQANAATKLYDATAALEPRRAEATRLAHDAQLQRRALGQAREALTQADATARIARDQLAARAGDLPPVFQPGESLTPESIDDARKRVATASAQANQAALALKAVRDQLGSARNAHGQLLQRKAVEVDGPQQRLLRVIDAAGHHAAGALLALGADPLGPRPDEPLDAIARWARDLLVRMADATSACAARVAAATAAASEARNTIGAERQRVGATNAEEFNELVVATATDIRRAEGEHNLAEAHAPLAADLDQRIARAGPFLDALDELSKLLADGKFVASVVKRKQRVLLAVASELLGEMSGRRFGFAEDFQIVDRLSGQPRDTKTLSGGETFLASLALALALVELAGRGGGRLEALFLDEGFGSLDANVLGDALDVLSRQAEGGRLVAVISHLRAVAENIEHVLLVTKDATGSDVRWVQGAERDALVESEASSGLVS
jgi:exonuclease SbcC